MRFIFLNIIFIVLSSVCYGDLNTTESITIECEKCSPCWSLFNKNYGPCSTEEYYFNFQFSPLSGVQPVCIDTLVLLVIMFFSIVICIPSCLWFLYLCMKRCRNIDGKYVVNGRLVA